MRFLCGVCGKEFDTSARRKQHELDAHKVVRGKPNKGLHSAVIAAYREKNK